MKLLLRKNVDKLGRIGSVVDVSNGYARNYLMPKGLAVHVTPGGIKQIEIAKRKEESLRKEENALLLKQAEDLKDFSSTITVKANEDGKLFGSVSAQMIANALKEEGFNVDNDMIVLDEPIKQCDVYNVTIAISSEIKTNIKLWVVKENEEEKDNKEAKTKE